MYNYPEMSTTGAELQADTESRSRVVQSSAPVAMGKPTGGKARPGRAITDTGTVGRVPKPPPGPKVMKPALIKRLTKNVQAANQELAQTDAQLQTLRINVGPKPADKYQMLVDDLLASVQPAERMLDVGACVQDEAACACTELSQKVEALQTRWTHLAALL